MPTASFPNDGSGGERLQRLSLRDVFAFLFRRWKLISLAMLLCAGAASAFLYVIPRGYTATGQILIEHTKQPTLRSEINRVPVDTVEVIQTEIGILTSRTVIERVVRQHELHIKGPPSTNIARMIHDLKTQLRDWGLINDTSAMDSAVIRFKSRLKVEQIPLTSAITCSYGDDDPAQAATILRSTMDAYLERRREIYANEAASFFRARLDDNTARIRSIQDRLQSTTDPSVEAELQLSLRGHEKSQLFWMAELDRAEAEAVNDIRLINARVVDYPTVPSRPGLPRIVLIVVGLVAGSALGIGAALVLDYLDHSIRDPDQLATLGPPVLGSIRKDRGIVSSLNQRRVDPLPPPPSLLPPPRRPHALHDDDDDDIDVGHDSDLLVVLPHQDRS